jgi:hypothetical protein
MNKKIEKRFIEARIDKLKNIKVDRNNVILNACAIQDQMLIDMGIKKRKRKTVKIEKEEGNIYFKKVSGEKEIITRHKAFLDNMTFAEKVGIKALNKLPLSLNEWKNIEKTTIVREDYKSNCAICLELLAKRSSILLSCTHVFHKVLFIEMRIVY